MQNNNLNKNLHKPDNLQELDQMKANEKWRKTQSFEDEHYLENSEDSEDSENASEKVNAFGAPLLGDSRDLFRPAAKDIPAQPGVYKWRDADAVSYTHL